MTDQEHENALASCMPREEIEAWFIEALGWNRIVEQLSDAAIQSEVADDSELTRLLWSIRRTNEQAMKVIEGHYERLFEYHFASPEGKAARRPVNGAEVRTGGGNG